MTDQPNGSENDKDVPGEQDKDDAGKKEMEEDINDLGIPKAIAESAAAAVTELKIVDFLRQHQDKIFDKLEEFEKYAESADLNGDMIFMALSMPLINGIIHVASTRQALQEATDKVLKKWEKIEKDLPDPEKVPILSALTLIYIVSQGWEKYKAHDDKTKKKRWNRIRDRILTLSGPLKDVSRNDV